MQHAQSPQPLPGATATSARSKDTSADQGLLSTWRARVIDISRLNWPLRLALLASILVAFFVALLIVLRDVPQPHLLLNIGLSELSGPIPTVAFVAAFALWLVAWACALTGAIHGHWALRLLVFAAFLYVMIESLILDAFSFVFIVPFLAIGLWMLAISVLRWDAQRRDWPLPSWLPVVTLALIFLCFAIHYAFVLAVSKQIDQAAREFNQLVAHEFVAYSLVLIPVLFLAGSDFAEWAEVAAAQVNALLRRLLSPWLLVGATVLTAGVILISQLIERGSFAPFDLFSVVDLLVVLVFGLIVGVLFLGVALLGGIAQWPRLRVPPGALVAATVAVMALLIGPVYLDYFVTGVSQPSAGSSVDYAVLRHPGSAISPAFSLIYPSDWQHHVSEPEDAEDLVAAFFKGQTAAGSPQMIVAGLPSDIAGGETQEQLARFVADSICEQKTCSVAVTAAPDHGQWRVERTVVHDERSNGQPVEYDGSVWERTSGATIWLLYGVAEPQGTQAATPIFTAMVDSWRSDLTAQIPEQTTSPIVTFLENVDPSGVLSLGFIPVLLGVIIGLPLLLRGRRRSGALAVTGLFFAVLGLCEGLLLLPDILARFGVPTKQIVLFALDSRHRLFLSNMPTLSLPVLQILAAVLTLSTVVWLALRGRLASGRGRDLVAALLLLNVGLQILSWIEEVFSASDRFAARFTAVQAVLLVVAFLWDLLTSGEQVTNTEGRRSPRFARVLLYLGFSLLSFSQVLFFSTLASPEASTFTDNWANDGLTLLGIPLLLTVVLQRLSQAGRPPQVETRPAEQPLTGSEQAIPWASAPSRMPTTGSQPGYPPPPQL